MERQPRRGGLSLRQGLVFGAGFLSALLLTRLQTYLDAGPGGAGRPGARKLVVAFGDSITQHGWSVEDGGYLSLLSDRYARRVDFLNRGFSGLTSRQGLEMFPQIVSSFSSRVDLFIICLGANDASLPGVISHVPVVEFERNIAKIVNIALETGAQVLMIGPPPVDKEMLIERNRRRGKAIHEDRQNAVTEQYSLALLKVGRDLKLPAIDLFSLLRADPHHLRDGLHLSSLGNKALFEAIAANSFFNFTSSLPTDF